MNQAKQPEMMTRALESGRLIEAFFLAHGIKPHRLDEEIQEEENNDHLKNHNHD